MYRAETDFSSQVTVHHLHAMTQRARYDRRPRFVVDEAGVEWEVYDETRWSIELALDWDSLPQAQSPGLIFSSSVDRRRFWPAPSGWAGLSDSELIALLEQARSVH